MGSSKQAVQGPSAAEIAAEKRALDNIAKEEKRKEEEETQRKRNLRGRRSLMSEENTGSGFAASDNLGN